MSEKVLNRFAKENLLSLLKGVFMALAVSIAGILIFAVVLKFVNVSDLVIKIVNQGIKILSVFFGIKVFTKNNSERGILKGICLGVLYTVFSYLIFSILSSNFSFGLSFLFDALFACVFGTIFGVILVNTKNK